MATNSASILLLSATFAAIGCSSSGANGVTANPDDGSASDASEADDGGSTDAPYATLDITLPDINEDDFTLVSRTKDDLHILCFWAVWCTPCQAELNKMMPMWEELKGRGLNVYAVSIDGPDSAARVPAYVQQSGWKFPILLDRETAFLTRYQPNADVPFYVILDADGEIVKTHQGYVKGDMKTLHKYLDEKLPAAE
ncbi:MAG: TlpA disulfide reductase family protein [Nannocystaceae bacterium]